MGKNHKFETNAVHGNYQSKQFLGSLTPPLFQTSTFTFNTAEQGEGRFSGNEEGMIYSRLGNPTVQLLEDKMAILEGAEKGLAFGSGMAAVSSVLLHYVEQGSHVLCSKGIYGCTFGLLKWLEEKLQITFDLLDMNTIEEIEEKISDKTACIFLETPINPTMEVIDLSKVVSAAKKHNIPVIVDNTFLSPYLQRPLEWGCDLVVHSATKYIGGHGDVVGGIVVGKAEVINEIAMHVRKDIGGIMSPFDAWLLLRGLKTLPVRMERHCDNAEKIVEKLKLHKKVDKLIYPLLTTNISEGQMSRAGGVISFTIHGEKEDAQKLLNNLHLIKVAVSLGDTETLIQHPATMTHAIVPEEQRLMMGITNQLVRLSVGLEAWEDIWEDLNQALNKL
ncbi:methionine-gamma-lyase [Bacillus mesophilus]|uniref:homocysteine desulfhydrase n=1 Tax=Bacillus mesophilus TaxID=1808955 RepID=A0A6M0Q6D3_9BACI|nr:methionine gamma-lyase [Bacillus mesophilus]MBM7660520.1 methionine-gamma-lyase [Bacillus mesophilus]NEY71931.1 methionine gamma-lyase [Bacillus mesophilus]